MDVLKESVKRTEEVGQNVSRNITSLAQSMQEIIQVNKQTMMQAFSQMLSSVGFTPALQSSYSQRKYPLALSFKTPPNVIPLPAPVIEFIPLATLPRVPIPVFGWTKENLSEER